MNKFYEITVKDKYNTKWGFNFWADPKYYNDWIDAGFDVNEVVNQIPEWIVNLGLTKIWCWLQDKHFLWME